MILSIDFRTDIPAFYSEWILNRFKEGYLYFRNPAYPNRLHKVILDKEHIEAIIWTSKDFSPILERLPEITDKFPSIFHYTITGYSSYGNDIEPNVPSVLSSIDTFKNLSIKYGSDKVIWRYDPVFYYEDINYNWHIQNFDFISKELMGYCNTCVINFISLYEKTKRHMPGIDGLDDKQKRFLIKSFIAQLNNSPLQTIEIQMCANGLNCKDIPGVIQTSCLGENILKLVDIYPKGKPNGCGCYPCTSIGEYDTCMHKCRYCYASSNFDKCEENYHKHDPKSPLLIGWPTGIEEIVKMKPKIINSGQLTLF